MSQVTYSPSALSDLERLYAFNAKNDIATAKQAVMAIMEGLEGLKAFPEMGRTIDNMELEFRQWPISFGKSGYIVRYRYDSMSIQVLAINHQKEVGFSW